MQNAVSNEYFRSPRVFHGPLLFKKSSFPLGTHIQSESQLRSKLVIDCSRRQEGSEGWGGGASAIFSRLATAPLFALARPPSDTFLSLATPRKNFLFCVSASLAWIRRKTFGLKVGAHWILQTPPEFLIRALAHIRTENDKRDFTQISYVNEFYQLRWHSWGH